LLCPELLWCHQTESASYLVEIHTDFAGFTGTHLMYQVCYASSSGFIGNAYESMQQPTSEYWKHIGGSFSRQWVSTDKFPVQQIGHFVTTIYPIRRLLVITWRAYFAGSKRLIQTPPCGGGDEYLHRDPASHRKQQKGKPWNWGSKIWSRVLRDSNPKMTSQQL
jgi:hypothetical protein